MATQSQFMVEKLSDYYSNDGEEVKTSFLYENLVHGDGNVSLKHHINITTVLNFFYFPWGPLLQSNNDLFSKKSNQTQLSGSLYLTLREIAIKLQAGLRLLPRFSAEDMISLIAQ